MPYQGKQMTVVTAEDSARLYEVVDKWNEILKNEYKSTDPDVRVTLTDLKEEVFPLEKDIFKKTTALISLIPVGVLSKKHGNRPGYMLQ